MSEEIEIIEVSPRDGLQNEPEIIATDTKIALINRAIEMGIKRIEVASFVNPKRVPQMADGEDVIKALPTQNNVTYIGLVLNERGAERALNTNIHELGAVACASDGFAMANQKQTSLESVDVAKRIIKMGHDGEKSVQVTISTAFGCPFDGEVSQNHVVEMVKKLLDANPREIAIADTIGVATPYHVKKMIEKLLPEMGKTPLRVHFHNTRNTGIANAWAAYEMGVRKFDSSLGGLGGCPFAPKATGNIPTEDLVYMMERSGINTNLDTNIMIENGLWLNDIMGRKLPSMLPHAGNFPN